MKLALITVAWMLVGFAGVGRADVIYLQTFSLPAGVKSAKVTDFGWIAYVRSSADAEKWESTVDTKRAVVSPSADQVSKDAANVKATAPGDSTKPGRGFVQGAGKGAILLITGKEGPDFKINPADYTNLTFSIRVRNETRKNNVPVRLVVKIGDAWYASSSFASSDSAGWKLTPDDAPNGYDTYEFTFAATAADWRMLDYTEGGSEPKIGKPVKGDLPKNAVTQFGFFLQTNSAAHRFDDIKVEGEKVAHAAKRNTNENKGGMFNDEK